MSTRHLLRRTRHLSTLSTTTTPPRLTPYDAISAAVSAKLSRLTTPDSRFLRHASPIPTPSDSANHLLQFPDLRLTTLPNGLRIATQPSLSSPTSSVSLLLDSGSRFDTDTCPGVAYLHHGLVLGSPLADVAHIGGEISGFVDREVTCLEVRVFKDRVFEGLDVLGRAFQDLDFSDDVFLRVRSRILKVKDKMDADMENIILDQLQGTAFQHTPLGRTIYGSVNDIQAITKEDIEKYISSHCAAHRMVIASTGAVKHEELVEQVKKVFTKLSANPTTTSQLVASDPVNFTGSEVRIIDDDLPLVGFAVAFEGASNKDPDSIALKVMQTMLGSWSKLDGGGKHAGSQLVQVAAISEVAESFRTFSINYKDTGLFGIYAVAKPDKLDDLSYGIMREISKLSYRVSDDDVIRARNQLKSSFLHQTNRLSSVSEGIGHQLLDYGRRIPCAEMFARIDAVDASTVKRVANRFLFDKDIAIAAMGPIKGLPDYNWFRRRTYWLRY